LKIPAKYTLQAPFVAFTAVGFMCMMVVVLIFPSETAPTAQTMNYSVVVVGGILFLSTTYYFLPVIGGRHWFTGPVRTVDDPASLKGSDTLSEKDSEHLQN
jgi:hypothetical protein